MRKQITQVVLIAVALAAVAQAADDNPRFGKWKLKSEAPAPQSNVMTYEPNGKHGMKITIDAVNRDGAKSQWYYTANFDGKDEAITGNPGSVYRVGEGGRRRRLMRSCTKKDGKGDADPDQRAVRPIKRLSG